MFQMRFKVHKKNGKRNKKQRYKCHNCGYIFENNRRKNNILNTHLWHKYVHENQTLKSLSKQYGISSRSIRNILDHHEINHPVIKSGKCVLVMDTCYFRRDFGVMVFRDNTNHRSIYWKYLKHETLAEYKSGIEHLNSKGWDISGIVCDGKRGLFTAFGTTPIQMCQFHQVAIIIRYITRNPRLLAGIELKRLTLLLTQSSKEDFVSLLEEWFNNWEKFLSERTHNELTGKWHYTHRRLRSAYRSLKTNIPYLFTYLEDPKLNIPNTTNSIEGMFSNLKTKLRVHSGIKTWRKKKFIDEILSK